jgi:hypothetical protein
MALTQVDQGLLGPQAQYTGFKNHIINGAMMIDQRNLGAEVNPAAAGTYYLDRWFTISSAASKFKIGQNAGSVTPPTGFTNYLGCTSLSAYSVGASDSFGVEQRIEGFNIADLGWGTASAATVTLSFWVRSSLTGTFGGSLKNSVPDRSYPFTYTISSANTWEQKSITIVGDTSGTWLTTNGVGIQVIFGMGVGSTLSGTAGAWAVANYNSATGATSVVGTSGATFYITGVQLEKGSTATSFDYRPYGTEFSLCKRYARVLRGSAYTKYANGTVGTTTAVYGFNYPLLDPMRAAPSISFAGTTSIQQGGAAFTLATINNLSSADSVTFDGTIASGTMIPGYAAEVGNDAGGTSVLTLSAEL